MVTTTPTTQLAISGDVRDFARERGLLHYLPALVDITEQVFAGADRLTAEVHNDPDVPDLRWVIVRAEVSWADPAMARAARDEWYARTAAVCPGPVLAHLGLDNDRRPR